MSASRSVAALAAFTEVSGCPTARAAFTQGVDLDRLVAGTGYDGAFGQSEYAFARGTRFESVVKGDRGNGVCSYGPLLELLRDDLGFDISQARAANLRAIHPPPPPHLLATDKRHLSARAADTRRLVGEIAREVPGCVNFIDGAVLSATVGGQTAFYETDGLAFRLGGKLRIVEIKSFPKVDGQVDPAALGSALDQGALYTLLVERLLADLGLESSLVCRRLVLICPRNVAMTPTLSERDVSARMRRIERLLDSIPHVGQQPVAPFGDAARAAGRTVAQRVAALEDICDEVGTCYGDACQSCGMLRLCRDRAHASGDVRTLGDRRARQLAGIPTLQRAVTLAGGSPPTAAEAGAAGALRAAAILRDQALTRTVPS
jgi:hypothetical protein